jgi:hypothetical protein
LFIKIYFCLNICGVPKTNSKSGSKTNSKSGSKTNSKSGSKCNSNLIN